MQTFTRTGKEIQVDDDDYLGVLLLEKEWGRRWSASKRNRVIMVVGNGTVVSLGRFIMQCPVGLVIDHIDRNPLNNQRHNLRPITQQKNLFNRKVNKNNTLGITGVTFNKAVKAFCAQIMIDGKQQHLGFFQTIEEAAKARHEAEQQL